MIEITVTSCKSVLTWSTTDNWGDEKTHLDYLYGAGYQLRGRERPGKWTRGAERGHTGFVTISPADQSSHRKSRNNARVGSSCWTASRSDWMTFTLVPRMITQVNSPTVEPLRCCAVNTPGPFCKPRSTPSDHTVHYLLVNFFFFEKFRWDPGNRGEYGPVSVHEKKKMKNTEIYRKWWCTIILLLIYWRLAIVGGLVNVLIMQESEIAIFHFAWSIFAPVVCQSFAAYICGQWLHNDMIDQFIIDALFVYHRFPRQSGRSVFAPSFH